MNMQKLAAAVRSKTGLTQRESWAAVRAMRNTIIEQLNDSQELRIGWLGRFFWRPWKLAIVKNSLDGKLINGKARVVRRVMPGHLRLTFRPAASIRTRPLPVEK